MNDLMADSIGNWISNGHAAENMRGVLKSHIFSVISAAIAGIHDGPPAETPTSLSCQNILPETSLLFPVCFQ